MAAVPLAAAANRRGARCLLAGIAIGPWGWDLSATLTRSLHFSELGVVFLMFIIGLNSIRPGFGNRAYSASARGAAGAVKRGGAGVDY